MRQHRPYWAAIGVVALAGLLVGLLPALAQPPPPSDALDRPAFVARNDVPFDALAVGPVAGALGGVVVITPPNALSQPAEDALVAFAPDIVYIVGGPAAISTQLEQDIDAAGPWSVQRVAGLDRDETAREISGLPALLGYDRPVLLETGGMFPQMWGQAYSQRSHDHGLNPGAPGEPARQGGVVTGTASAVDDSPWSEVAELTVPGGNLVSNCPVGTPIHNFLVEGSATVERQSGTPVAAIALTVDSATFPSSVGGDDATTLRQASLNANIEFATLTSHFLVMLPEGPTRTFRLLAMEQSGTGTFDVDPATLVVKHYGYECSP